MGDQARHEEGCEYSDRCAVEDCPVCGPTAPQPTLEPSAELSDSEKISACPQCQGQRGYLITSVDESKVLRDSGENDVGSTTVTYTAPTPPPVDNVAEANEPAPQSNDYDLAIHFAALGQQNKLDEMAREIWAIRRPDRPAVSANEPAKDEVEVALTQFVEKNIFIEDIPGCLPTNKHGELVPPHRHLMAFGFSISQKNSRSSAKMERRCERLRYAVETEVMQLIETVQRELAKVRAEPLIEPDEACPIGPPPHYNIPCGTSSMPPRCSKHNEPMVLNFYDRPGSPPGNNWMCQRCVAERAAEPVRAERDAAIASADEIIEKCASQIPMPSPFSKEHSVNLRHRDSIRTLKGTLALAAIANNTELEGRDLREQWSRLYCKATFTNEPKGCPYKRYVTLPTEEFDSFDKALSAAVEAQRGTSGNVTTALASNPAGRTAKGDANE